MSTNEEERFNARVEKGSWVPGKTPDDFDEDSLGVYVGANITWATFITGLGRGFKAAADKGSET